MLNEIIKYFENLKELVKKRKWEVSDNIIFQESCTFVRGERISQERALEKPNPAKEPITPKQLAFLKKNNYEGDLNISKADAFQLIQEYIQGTRGEKDGQYF